jgi:hypothetical protein
MEEKTITKLIKTEVTKLEQLIVDKAINLASKKVGKKKVTLNNRN